MDYKSGKMLIGAQLDLKGVQPKEEYIKTYIRELKSLGYNALIVEYEDMFPFASMTDIADDPKRVWSRKRLDGFLRYAASEGLEIIPLQQTLGHLEYVFRWDKYAKYTEDRSYPATLKLSSKQGKEKIKSMLREVIEAHPESRYVHLGMDEARHLKDSSLVKKQGGVLPLFLSYLAILCDIVEEYGKTPIIWSDMIEDNYTPDSALNEFRDRVVLMIWDYNTTGTKTTQGRIQGQRVSRFWQKRLDHPDAPMITSDTKFLEDLPANVLKEVKGYCQDGYWPVYWQVDFFSKLGFRIIGGSATRKSSDGAVMPDYGNMVGNIDAWHDAIKRNAQLGIMLTSWERGTTFCPPNYNLDLQWLGLEHLGRKVKPGLKSFWLGLKTDDRKKLLSMLTRCRQGWALESTALELMDKLEKSLSKNHRHEWQSLRLMVEQSALDKRIDFCGAEMEYFHADQRLPSPEWKRRLTEHEEARKDIARLRKKVTIHLGKRYHGKAFDEWLRHIFDLNKTKLDSWSAECREKLALATKRYQ